eukprot:CAMPEP_0115121746 /NCGR_PEP_ID=MMETSP0227-20121206/46418_1 /TAXON_ID=89957 /ORGANISM="Polarella glacialis, Strain CCMP 1383" /LENGTH=407 /DNA_ID=CAMNT_0002523561 /DNA_START=38 /DNA_END=1261 /DNA_ORIENTATION=-
MTAGKPSPRVPRRLLTAMQLLEEECIEGEVTYGGPWKDCTDAEDRVRDAIAYLIGSRLDKAGLDQAGSSKLSSTPRDAATDRAGRNSTPAGILPLPTEENLKEGKFVCHFEVGLEDDEEFCLVKRIYGKGGCCLKGVAEQFSAKLRLRGRGSGFLEGKGKNKQEADCSLKLYVSCENSDCYCGAVREVAKHLFMLYKHYRRYARLKGLEVPKHSFAVMEEIRTDHGIFRSSNDQAWDAPAASSRNAPQPEVPRGSSEATGAAARAAAAASYRAATRAAAAAARATKQLEAVNEYSSDEPTNQPTSQSSQDGDRESEDINLKNEQLERHSNSESGQTWIEKGKHNLDLEVQYSGWRNWDMSWKVEDPARHYSKIINKQVRDCALQQEWPSSDTQKPRKWVPKSSRNSA